MTRTVNAVLSATISLAAVAATCFASACGTTVFADPVDMEIEEGACELGDDRFENDGETGFDHYRLHQGQRLLLRRVTTNPDIEICVVAGHRVYFIDPEFGVLGFDRSPETDPVVSPVYLQPPTGAGDIVPVRIFVDGENLQIAGALGRVAAVPLPAAPFRPETMLTAVALTDPVDHDGDAADDPAIIHFAGTDEAWILGADKSWGLRVYDLAGRERLGLPAGKLNNVDALPLDDGRFLITASNRTKPAISVFVAKRGGDAPDIEHFSSVPLALDDPYGLCMAVHDGKPTVFVGDKDGNVESWQFNGALEARRTGSYRFAGQTEGCVVHDGILYVGEEEHGVWAVDLASGRQTQFAAADGTALVADVEGLDILETGKRRWLLVSSQGNDSFSVFEIPRGKLAAQFVVGEDLDAGIDAVSETDGLAIHSGALPGYPDGILVLQDGRNVMPPATQNFKIVDLAKVRKLLH